MKCLKENTKMIPNERQERILKILEEKKTISSADLLKMMDISESTLRRDLILLEEQGKCERVHGGVSLTKTADVPSTGDRTLSLRRKEHSEEKQVIGKEAAKLTQDGDLIYVDSGTTTEALLKALSGNNMHIVTNSVNHAILAAEKGINVTLVGGKFKSLTNAVVGEEAVQFIEKYTFDKGFFGTNAITSMGALQTPDIREAAVKNKAMRQSKEVYILADSSKFQKTSKIRFGTLDQGALVSDQDPAFLNEKPVFILAE